MKNIQITPEEVFLDTMTSAVYLPEFLKRAAELGREIPEDAVQEAVEIAARSRNTKISTESEAIKTAAAIMRANDPVGEALDAEASRNQAIKSAVVSLPQETRQQLKLAILNVLSNGETGGVN